MFAFIAKTLGYKQPLLLKQVNSDRDIFITDDEWSNLKCILSDRSTFIKLLYTMYSVKIEEINDEFFKFNFILPPNLTIEERQTLHDMIIDDYVKVETNAEINREIMSISKRYFSYVVDGLLPRLKIPSNRNDFSKLEERMHRVDKLIEDNYDTDVLTIKKLQKVVYCNDSTKLDYTSQNLYKKVGIGCVIATVIVIARLRSKHRF